MKRMKYTDAIDQISVSQEKQDEVWKQIEKRVEQKGRVKIRKTRRAAAAAAVIACAVTVSGVAFADEIEEFFTGFLTKNEIIQNDVKIDTGSKEGSISGTLTIICNTGQSRQSEIPQLPNDPEEQIEQLGE